MRVKRLEVQGFKSFKDKTVIHFDEGITGIVGPNGCGKSNIVDAFFWVMGEQSYKHMRGTGSDDLIFNGSSKYSPLGLAEATLVMETNWDVGNEEKTLSGPDAPAGATAAPVTRNIPAYLKGKEVSVTRRLYRSGEGEYLINGLPARLKDIQELFMDTGVGAKGYSVIEQGQIGKIVNAKPEDRRLLIEEAAGIAKYKARKKESLRKMEATQANLARLNDVIQEIERNLASLERQAQKARHYKKYKDELLEKEMTWGRRKRQVLIQKMDALKKQRDALDQELVGLRAELQTAENRLETERVDQVTDAKASEELQSQIQELASELTFQKSALDLSNRRQTDLANQIQALESEKTDLEVQIVTEREKLVSRETETGEAENAFRQAAQKAQELDEQARALRQTGEARRRALDSTKRKLMADIAQASSLNSRAASLAAKAEAAQDQAERLAAQVEEYTAKVEQSREESEKASMAAQEVREKREKLQAERRTQSEQIQTFEQTLKQSERELTDSSRKVTQLRSRLQSLEELAAAHEGFGDGPKAALDWAKSQGLENQLRTIAESLEVEKGYEAALEGWLETRLELLVSDNPEVALKALSRIREEKQGRAGVQVARSGRDVSASSLGARKALDDAGFAVLGELSDFVKAQDPAGHLVAQVLVVRDFSPMASFLAQGLAQGGIEKLGETAVVSIAGEVLDRDGILRGGVTASSEANSAATLLGRKRAIQDLQVELAVAEEAFSKLENAVQESRKQNELARARQQTLQTELQALEVQAAALERDIHQMNRAVREAESQLQYAIQNKDRMAEESRQAQEDKEAAEAQVSEILSERVELESKIAQEDTELTSYEAEVRAHESELQALRVNEASLRERSISLKREYETGRALVADRERRTAEINRLLDRVSKEHEQHTGGDSGIKQKIEELTLALAAARGQLSIVKDRLEQSGAKLNAFLDRIKELHKIGDHKTTEVNQLAIDAEKFSGEMNHLIQNLEEKYGPGCFDQLVANATQDSIQEEMTDPVVTTEMSAQEEQLLFEEVEKLRERIRRLGEVNVSAIEDYEEAKKRFDYLAQEKSDLERSLENLQEAIEHINKTSEERFRKAFEAISTRFERLFPIIFGGGSAKLSLVFPEGSNDILEAGVDIMAQPPGKKVSNITLLSGGEKALTAVSMIFAIFMVKPSPFCVLDEVDAPLDDANIGKFNALLREMSAKSQFILITHNKKTMELNDTLYGVTMEEPGVSKMVSIQLQ